MAIISTVFQDPPVTKCYCTISWGSQEQLYSNINVHNLVIKETARDSLGNMQCVFLNTF